MANIIEQQDLLKGLPDDRLSTLMQNPTGDIPPFLVAAEAQRRQSIREQFSGGPQESVVDTLTKQMANVPQNIQAPAQQPPQMPQMGGVADLQGEQQMRRGGYVQRYGTGSLVSPTMSSQYYVDPFGVPDASGGDMSVLGDVLGDIVPDLGLPPILPQWKTADELAADKAERERNTSQPYSYGMTSSERQMMEKAPAESPPPLDPTKTGTSLENQRKTSLEEKKKKLAAMWASNPEDAAYVKAELDKLYGNNELSDWEKSQKWFAAAQAAVQPGQNNWQAAINALSALGGGMAEERAMQRASDREKAEALFKYGLAERQAAAADKRDYAKAVFDLEQSEEDRIRSEKAAADEQYLKGAEIASDDQRAVAEMHQKSADRADQEANRLVDRMIKDGGVSPEEAERNPEVMRLRKKANDYYILANDALTGASLGLKRYSEASGVDLNFETANGVDPIRSGQ